MITGHLNKKTNTYLLNTLFVFLISGCIGDSYSPITITNNSADIITIQLKENINFVTEKEKIASTADGLSVYKLIPHEVFVCGHVINGIDNNIPFSEIRIICKGDTLVNNQGDAKILFDKTFYGIIKAPYNISIKK